MLQFRTLQCQSLHFTTFTTLHLPAPPQAYFILDEFLLAGEVQETSKKCVLNAIKLQVRTGGYGGSTALQDFVMEEETPQGVFEEAGLG